MQSGYSILDHPSDLGIEAHGSNLSESFELAAEALMSIILDVTSVEGKESKEVSISGSDLEQLLVKWLAEILYLYDGQRFVGKTFTITDLTPRYLKAGIIGEHFSDLKHRTKLDVKAITYHQLCVRQSADGAEVRVFLDI